MPSEFDLTTTQDIDADVAPEEAEDLYRALVREGAAWRTAASPEINRVNQRLQAHALQLKPGSDTDAPANRISPLRTVTPPYEDSPRPAPGGAGARPYRAGWRTWMATGVTVALVIAFLATLTLAARQRPTGSTYSPTSPRVTGAAPASWVDLSRLDYSTDFAANDPPAIVLSNPNVVYETLAQGMQQHQPATMRMTTDGGATWRKLVTPVQADHIGYMGVGVSPINPQTVFLTLIDTDAAECPANQVQLGEGNAFCRLQYTSVDGGVSWTATGLPLANDSKPGILAASINDGAAGPIQSSTVRAQGQRLFAGYICADYSCTRLVASDDGGRNWRFTDQGLLSSGAANVCDYTATAMGATLYAVTSASDCSFTQQASLTLWRSEDGGVSWAKIGKLATPNERGMVLTQNGATGATLLYMGLPRTDLQATDKMGGHFPVFTQSPSDVKVSVDGGVTWQAAPTRGIPAGHVVYLNIGLLGALSDGSIMVDVIPSNSTAAVAPDNFSGSDLYAWKPGDSGWRHIASVPREIDSLLVTPSKTGAGDTLYTILINRGNPRADTFAVIKLDYAH